MSLHRLFVVGTAVSRGSRLRHRCFASSAPVAPQLLSFDGVGLDELRRNGADAGTGRRRRRGLLVLLHGVLGNKRNWRTLTHSFANHQQAGAADGQRMAVLSMDLRGHGHSGAAVLESLDARQGQEQGQGGGRDLSGETVAACARDVAYTLASLRLAADEPVVLCAHSFGGKVALTYLQQQAMETGSGEFAVQGAPLPRHTWIVDSIPGTHQHQFTGPVNAAGLPTFSSRTGAGGSVNSTVNRVMHALLQLLGQQKDRQRRYGGPNSSTHALLFPSREGMVGVLTAEPFCIDAPIAQWLATSTLDVPGALPAYLLPPGSAPSATTAANSTAPPSHVRVMVDLSSVLSMFVDYCRLPMWSMLEQWAEGAGGADRTIHFLRAGRNLMWDAVDGDGGGHTPLQRLSGIAGGSGLRLAVHTMPSVGHWVHSEDPAGFKSLLLRHSGDVLR